MVFVALVEKLRVLEALLVVGPNPAALELVLYLEMGLALLCRMVLVGPHLLQVL